jgi:hypothetical protein
MGGFIYVWDNFKFKERTIEKEQWGRTIGKEQ